MLAFNGFHFIWKCVMSMSFRWILKYFCAFDKISRFKWRCTEWVRFKVLFMPNAGSLQLFGKEWHCSGHEYTFHQLFIKKFLQHFHFVSSSIVLRSSNSTVIKAAKQVLFVKFLALIQPSKQWMKPFHFYCVVLLSFDIGNCYCCSNNIPMEEFKCFDCYK